MAERTHFVSDGVRITARVGRVWLFFYQSWSATTTREVRVRGTRWWDPFSWFSGEHWERDGRAPDFAVHFFSRNGDDITRLVRPRCSRRRGVNQCSIVFAQIGWSGGTAPGGAGIDDLRTDARAVSRVRMEYSVDGEAYALTEG